MTQEQRLLRVVAPHFVASAVWEPGKLGWHCTSAAPNLRWMLDLSPQAALDALQRKGYEWEWIRD